MIVARDLSNTTRPGGSARRRWTFSLAALLGFMTIVCVLAALWSSTREYSVIAYIEVSQTRPNDSTSVRVSFQEIERRAMNSLALAKSPKVIGAAVAQPGIRDLSVASGGSGDALQRVTSRLQVKFPGEGEVMEMRLEGRGPGAEEDRKLLKAVADAFRDEVEGQNAAASPGSTSTEVRMIQSPVIQRR